MGPLRDLLDLRKQMNGDGAPRALDTVEQRMMDLREAHIDYVDLLHVGTDEEIMAARDAVREALNAA
ncbi:MAG TPA: hypothetical protein VK965_04430, partial [Halomonas sp.]|nr:hypothetical protein [Halomonas sp.]